MEIGSFDPLTPDPWTAKVGDMEANHHIESLATDWEGRLLRCFECDSTLREDEEGDTWAADDDIGAWHITGPCREEMDERVAREMDEAHDKWINSPEGQAQLLAWAQEDELDLLDGDWVV